MAIQLPNRRRRDYVENCRDNHRIVRADHPFGADRVSPSRASAEQSKSSTTESQSFHLSRDLWLLFDIFRNSRAIFPSHRKFQGTSEFSILSVRDTTVDGVSATHLRMDGFDREFQVQVCRSRHIPQAKYGREVLWFLHFLCISCVIPMLIPNYHSLVHSYRTSPDCGRS
jgi:hypothetical protein